MTFGGGLTMLPILDRELVKKRKWLTAVQMVDYVAIGQSTPGIIAVNISTFVGYRRHAVAGALVATAGMVAPSLIIITILALFLEGFSGVEVVQRGMRGINVVVAVLLVNAVIDLGRKTLIDWYTVVLGFCAFLAIVVINVAGVFVVTGSAVLGLAAVYLGIRPLKPLPGGHEE